jgi:hypothetical protein
MAVELEGFRAFVDDGNEVSASALASQDVNFTFPTNRILRTRFIVNTTGDEASTQYRLEAKKSTDSVWVAVSGSLPTTSGSATFGAVGTAGAGTTSCTPTYPAGITAASALYLFVHGESATPGTAPAITGGGWTKLGFLEAGSGSFASDLGPRRIDIFKKDAVAGTESGTITVTLAGGATNTLRASIVRVEIPSGYQLTQSFVSGSDIVHNTAWQITGSHAVGFHTGSLVFVATTTNVDTATQSAQSLDVTGLTFGTRVSDYTAAVTNGNDHRAVLDHYSVTGSNTTATPQWRVTLSANASGVTGFLVISAIANTSLIPIQMATSSFIAASAADTTTARLTPPSGKTTADFEAGRISDDTNPLPAIDLTSGKYTEVAWSVMANSAAVNGDIYQFRLTKNSSSFDTYSVTPQWTIGDLVSSYRVIHVQSSGASGDPATATFGSTPVSGNLLIAVAGDRSGTDEASFTINGTGWVKRLGHNSQIGDINARKTTVVWSKVADVGEPTSVQVDDGTANQKKLLLHEFSSSAGLLWTFVTSGSGDTGAGSTSPFSTGYTVISASGEQFIFGAGTFRNESAVAPTAITWTNENLGFATSSLGATSEVSLQTVFTQSVIPGRKTSNVAWTGAGLESAGSLIIFTLATGSSGGGGSPTSSYQIVYSSGFFFPIYEE